MEKNKITVIVPVFNAERWLSRCLNSILNNSYENLEIICVNDGSTDNSLALLREFEIKDRRILIVDQPNGGVSSARNKGLEMATGGYISFVDADDWIHKDYFKIMMSAIGETDIVQCGFIRCDHTLPDLEINNITKRVVLSSEISLIPLLKGPCWGMIYKRSVLRTIQFPLGVKMIEDKVFTIQVLCNASSVTILNCNLYYYFINAGSASDTFGLELYPAALEMLKIAKITNNPIILHDAYTAFLAHRYLNMFDENSKYIRVDCNERLRQCNILAKKIMPFAERAKLNLMVYLPCIYRLYRIVTDPTMLDWEKNQKQKRKHH